MDYLYGEERWSSGTVPTDYRFTDQKLDGYIRLYQMGARWYDSYINRFLSPDSIIPDPSDPQSLNRFAYVYNNPLRYRDPSGHQGECGPWDLWCWVNLAVEQVRAAVSEWWYYHGPCGMSVDPLCQWLPGAVPEVSVPQLPLFLSGTTGEQLSQVGRWVKKAESMSAAARAYQRFISGRSDDMVFEVEGYAFDGMDAERGVLLDAKHIPGSFVNETTGEFSAWVAEGPGKWLTQAENQMEVSKALGGVPIEWHFDTQAARDAMYYLFEQENAELLEYITLIWTPETN